MNQSMYSRVADSTWSRSFHGAVRSDAVALVQAMSDSTRALSSCLKSGCGTLIFRWPCAELWVGWGGVKSLIMDGVPLGGVRFFGGHCAWVAPCDRGAGLTPVKSGVWSAFPRICRPVPLVRGEGCGLKRT